MELLAIADVFQVDRLKEQYAISLDLFCKIYDRNLIILTRALKIDASTCWSKDWTRTICCWSTRLLNDTARCR